MRVTLDLDLDLGIDIDMDPYLHLKLSLNLSQMLAFMLIIGQQRYYRGHRNESCYYQILAFQERSRLS